MKGSLFESVSPVKKKGHPSAQQKALRMAYNGSFQHHLTIAFKRSKDFENGSKKREHTSRGSKDSTFPALTG